jgi:methyl-accepting chemotaxis protein
MLTRLKRFWPRQIFSRVKLKNIAGKVMSGVALSTLIVIGVGGTSSYLSFERIQLRVDKLVQSIDGIQTLTSMSEIALQLDDAQKRFLLETREDVKEDVLSDLTDKVDEMEGNIRAYERVFASGKESEIFKTEVVPRLEEWRQLNEKIVALVEEGNAREAISLSNEKGSDLITVIIDEKLSEISDSIEETREADQDAVGSALQKAQFYLLIASVIGLAVALGIGWFIARGISKNIRRFAAVVDGIASGDLNQDIKIQSRDEIGEMAARMSAMIKSLQEIIARVRLSAKSVAGRADDIGTNSVEMARSAKNQVEFAEKTLLDISDIVDSIEQVSVHASELAGDAYRINNSIFEMISSNSNIVQSSDTMANSVDTISVSIAKMATGIEKISENVRYVNQEAEVASRSAVTGHGSVNATIEGMTHISSVMTKVNSVIYQLDQRASEIMSIVDVINDIAERTHVLALNATVEAAHAGQYGRGFAVVAVEVRKLAEKSANSSRDIAAVLRAIQVETRQAVATTAVGDEAIQNGVQLAESAGKALAAIVASVSQVRDLTESISSAIQDQTVEAANIAQSTANASRLSRDVKSAIGEQAKATHVIAEAIQSMTELSELVSNATAEQRKGGESVQLSTKAINVSAEDTSMRTEGIASSSQDLRFQASVLIESIGFFKSNEDEDLVSRENDVVVFNEDSQQEAAVKSNRAKMARAIIS